MFHDSVKVTMNLLVRDRHRKPGDHVVMFNV